MPDAQSSHRRRGCAGSQAFFGLALVTLGALFLLDNLNVLEARGLIRTFWPLLLVAWGGYQMLLGRGTGRLVGAAALTFGALLLGNRLLGWSVRVGDLFVPVVLILAGLVVLSRSFRPRRPPRDPGTLPAAGAMPAEAPRPDAAGDMSSVVNETAVFAGIHRRNLSQTFRGGEATAVMGGIELDLRDCRMAGAEAQIDILAMMGGIELRIPKEWTVESRLTAILAGVDDRSSPPVGTGSPRLILQGTALLGGVEIKN
jgi:hypothetical protein